MPVWLAGTLFAGPPGSEAYALLDAAAIPGLVQMMSDGDVPHDSLYQGDAARDLVDVAPYLAQLDWSNRFTRNLFTQGNAGWYLFDSCATLFLSSPAPEGDLRRRLRRLTKVTDGDGRGYYLRFWEALTLFDILAADQAGTMTRAFRPDEQVFSFDHHADGTDFVTGGFIQEALTHD